MTVYTVLYSYQYNWLDGCMKVRSIHERYDNYAMMMPNCFNVTVSRAVSPLFDIFSAIATFSLAYRSLRSREN